MRVVSLVQPSSLLINNSIHGNILFIVLLFLFLSTSIVMTASISSALELKMAGQFNEKNEVFRAAENALNQVASMLKTKSNCYQAMQPIQVWRDRSVVWWLKLGRRCSLDQGKIKVRFVIEPFEHDPCLHAESSLPQNLDFFRITIFAMSASRRSVVRLQAVYAVASQQQKSSFIQEISSLASFPQRRESSLSKRISSFNDDECLTTQQIRAGWQSWIEF